MSAEVVIAVVGLMLLCLGLMGIVRARNAIRHHGKTTPLEFPAPLPWLHSKPTTANDIARIGQLYAIAGVMLCAYSVASGLKPTTTRSEDACDSITQALIAASTEHLTLREQATTASTNGCVRALVDDNGSEWFRIESTPVFDAIGEGFNAGIRNLNRNGMAVTPLANLGVRAAIGEPAQQSVQPTIIMFENSRGLHTIHLFPQAQAVQRISELIKQLPGD